MKICYFSNSRFPSERAHVVQIVSMCNAFARAGHEVTLLVTNRRTSISEDPEIFYGTKILSKVVRAAVPDVVGRINFLPPFLRPFGVLVQRLCFAYQVLQHLHAHSYDVVYGRDEWILWVLSCFTRTHLVYESHEAKYTFVARALIKKLQSIIVISEGIFEYYRKKGVEKEKMLVAHDAVDVRFFEPHISVSEARRALGITEHKPIVMYIGGLDAWKGVEVLFRATAGEESFLIYVIGGSESEIAHYRALYPHIRFLGARPYRELPKHQQAGDVLVIPNTGKNELSAEYTSPLKLFAHMTSKKPLVVARTPSIERVVTDREVWFFTPDDPMSLKETIIRVLQGDSEDEKKILGTYEKSTHYTWDLRANAIVDFIRRKI